jgi:hypothetical protein
MAIISNVKVFLEKRAIGNAVSPQIHELEVAAAAAFATGDRDGALAFQRAADQLRRELLASKTALAQPATATASTKRPDTRLIASQWSALNAARVHLTKTACVLDCGERGNVTITPTGITLSGSLQTDPTALLLVARHAQLHWNGHAVAAGSNDFKFGIAVASSMLGVKTKRARINRSRRSEADDLSQAMRPILDGINGAASPSRPTASGRSSRPGATFSSATPTTA